MDANLVRDIRRNMETKSTDELIQIYRRHDEEAWSSEAFEAIRQVLTARGEGTPTIDPIFDTPPQIANNIVGEETTVSREMESDIQPEQQRESDIEDLIVTIATFAAPWEARLAKNALEAAGIDAVLADEALTGVNPLLTNAVGGIKLQVRAHEADAARLHLAGPPPVPSEKGEAEEGNEESASRDLSPPLNSRELAARRAFRGAVVGLVLLPIQLYVFWLLVHVCFSQAPLRASPRWQAILAAMINLPLVCGGLPFLVGRMIW